MLGNQTETNRNPRSKNTKRPRHHDRFTARPLKAAVRPTGHNNLFVLARIAFSNCGDGSQAVRWMTGCRQSAKSYTRCRLHRIAASPAAVKPKKNNHTL